MKNITVEFKENFSKDLFGMFDVADTTSGEYERVSCDNLEVLDKLYMIVTAFHIEITKCLKIKSMNNFESGAEIIKLGEFKYSLVGDTVQTAKLEIGCNFTHTPDNVLFRVEFEHDMVSNPFAEGVLKSTSSNLKINYDVDVDPVNVRNIITLFADKLLLIKVPEDECIVLDIPKVGHYELTKINDTLNIEFKSN